MLLSSHVERVNVPRMQEFSRQIWPLLISLILDSFFGVGGRWCKRVDKVGGGGINEEVEVGGGRWRTYRGHQTEGPGVGGGGDGLGGGGQGEEDPRVSHPEGGGGQAG